MPRKIKSKGKIRTRQKRKYVKKQKGAGNKGVRKYGKKSRKLSKVKKQSGGRRSTKRTQKKQRGGRTLKGWFTPDSVKRMGEGRTVSMGTRKGSWASSLGKGRLDKDGKIKMLEDLGGSKRRSVTYQLNETAQKKIQKAREDYAKARKKARWVLWSKHGSRRERKRASKLAKAELKEQINSALSDPDMAKKVKVHEFQKGVFSPTTTLKQKYGEDGGIMTQTTFDNKTGKYMRSTFTEGKDGQKKELIKSWDKSRPWTSTKRSKVVYDKDGNVIRARDASYFKFDRKEKLIKRDSTGAVTSVIPDSGQTLTVARYRQLQHHVSAVGKNGKLDPKYIKDKGLSPAQVREIQSHYQYKDILGSKPGEKLHVSDLALRGSKKQLNQSLVDKHRKALEESQAQIDYRPYTTADGKFKPMQRRIESPLPSRFSNSIRHDASRRSTVQYEPRDAIRQPPHPSPYSQPQYQATHQPQHPSPYSQPRYPDTYQPRSAQSSVDSYASDAQPLPSDMSRGGPTYPQQQYLQPRPTGAPPPRPSRPTASRPQPNNVHLSADLPPPRPPPELTVNPRPSATGSVRVGPGVVPGQPGNFGERQQGSISSMSSEASSTY